MPEEREEEWKVEMGHQSTDPKGDNKRLPGDESKHKGEEGLVVEQWAETSRRAS